MAKSLKNIPEFLPKLLAWSQQYSHAAVLVGNDFPDTYSQYSLVFGIGAKRILKADQDSFDVLEKEHKNSWLFGYISYDAKNEVEKLHSKNDDRIKAPQLYFFEPEIVGYVKNDSLYIAGDTEFEAEIFREIFECDNQEANALPSIDFAPRLSHQEYLQKVKALQNHIQLGDIYEVNFCQEFFAENQNINPTGVFLKLNQKAKPPFAAFLNLPELAVMCASPERYLQKNGDVLVSQPIKGTAKKSNDFASNEVLKAQLQNSVKERAENVMIVDLVRNDLSRVAEKASVQVPELFGVYTFPTVNQLISTVTAKLNSQFSWVDVLKTSFPMGSMTGAPKVRAMQLIEDFEAHKRGIYSGALGYITPAGDFDFNVVIRSLVYNKSTQYLSLSVGGAITILADAEAEYKECLLKAEAIFSLFRAETP